YACHERLSLRESHPYSEQRTHEFICVYLAFASVYVWIGLHTAKTFDLGWMWLGGDYGNVFLMGLNGIQWYALIVKPTVYVSHIRQFWSTARIETTKEGTKNLATVDGTLRTVTESSLRRNLKVQDEEGISSLLDTELFKNLTRMGYNISPNQKFTFQKVAIFPLLSYALLPTGLTIFDGLVKNVNNKGEGLGTPTEPYHTPSPEAHPTSHTTHSSPILPPVTTTSIPTITPFKTTPIRQYTQRARIAQDDAPIKGRNLDEGEAAAERVSDDTEEMAIVLTSMDAATVLASGAAKVPTSSGSIPTAGSLAAEVSTGSDVVPTANPVFATATVVTPYRSRNGKEIMVESETPKKKKVDRDTKVARIYAEEELQMMINSLDRSKETQKRDYYMAVIKSNLGWKVKDFRGMTFQEIEAKFTTVWKQLEDFIPMGSKEEAERLKRKGLSLEQESVKKLKSSEEVAEEAKSPDEVPEEKVKEMMQLVPIEKVYVEALQVKQPIIDWKKKREATAVKDCIATKVKKKLVIISLEDPIILVSSGITTRSGTVYQRPTIPTTASSLPKVVERETEVTKDTMPPANNGSTKYVQPPVVQTETPN
nr:reverse transcriptase domain-containing protein [Tanacetum cinerariifolium]